jgi:hypothetical protein
VSENAVLVVWEVKRVAKTEKANVLLYLLRCNFMISFSTIFRIKIPFSFYASLYPCHANRREAARAKKDAQCASNAKDIAKAKEERTKKIAAKKVCKRRECEREREREREIAKAEEERTKKIAANMVGDKPVPCTSLCLLLSLAVSLCIFYSLSFSHSLSFSLTHTHMSTRVHLHLTHNTTLAQTLNREEEKVSLGEIQNVMANGTQWEKVCLCMCVCVCERERDGQRHTAGEGGRDSEREIECGKANRMSQMILLSVLLSNTYYAHAAVSLLQK